MSLINDALRKAQARQPGAMNQPAQASPQAAPPQRKTLHLVIGFGVVSSIGSVVVAVVLYFAFISYEVDTILGPDEQPVAEATAASPQATVDTAQEPPEVAAVAEEQENETAAAPVVKEAAPETTPVVGVEAAKESDPIEELQEWVDGVEVRGVMSGAGRVLLYLPREDLTAPFSTGEVVDKEGRLSLEQILPNRLVFKDNGGHEYTRRF